MKANKKLSKAFNFRAEMKADFMAVKKAGASFSDEYITGTPVCTNFNVLHRV